VVYDLAHLANSELPSLASANQELRAALRDCFAPSCEVPPPRKAAMVESLTREESPVGDIDTLTAASRRRIMDFLKQHSNGVRLTQPQGIQKSFLGLSSMIEADSARKDYKAFIRSLEFSNTEYTMIMKPQLSALAQARFTQSWRAFLTAVRSPYAEQPLSFTNVVQAIRAIDKG
jgi:hypothetical protein